MNEVSSTRPLLQPLVISAPFGNYVQLDHSTATLGTFTSRSRGGRIVRAVRALGTVRYYPRLRAWVSGMGANNPGIDWLAQKVFRGAIDVSDKIVSIRGSDAQEWYHLLERIDEIKPLALELSMGHAGGEQAARPADLFERALAACATVIVKVPPVGSAGLIEEAHAAGIRYLHCCSALPVRGGGMSGKPLMPLSLQCIREVRARPFGAELTIIGGGGVYEPDDVDEYVRAGADHVAIGSKLLHPKYLIAFDSLQPIIDRACALLPVPEPADEPVD